MVYSLPSAVDATATCTRCTQPWTQRWSTKWWGRSVNWGIFIRHAKIDSHLSRKMFELMIMRPSSSIFKGETTNVCNILHPSNTLTICLRRYSVYVFDECLRDVFICRRDRVAIGKQVLTYRSRHSTHGTVHCSISRYYCVKYTFNIYLFSNSTSTRNLKPF